MSLWTYYKNLSPRSKALLGGGIIAYSIAGLYLSDMAEKRLGYTPTEEDKKRLDEMVPKVRVVDRDEVPRS